jgi:RNA polymerase sigma-70 factor (ECF subfamily)
MGDVTGLLDRWNSGDPEALKELLGAVHGELRRLAKNLLRGERVDHTLQPTELVHEAFIRLTGLRTMHINGRRHLYGAVAEAMRRILVVRLDEALTALAALAPEKARVVELRYFAGLSIQETAEVMEISPATVKRHWTFARAWLYRDLSA